MQDKTTLERYYSNRNFNDARTAFIDLFPLCDNQTKLDLLEHIARLADTPEEYLVVLNFYEQLKIAGVKALNYIRQCPHQDDSRIKTKRITLERKYGEIETALGILENSDNNEYNMVQKAATLNQSRKYEEAREVIENCMMLKKISVYEIRTYATIINSILKKDEDALQLCIPNLARSICKEEYKTEKNLEFDFKRLLRKVIEFEDNFGDKRNKERTEKILNLFLKCNHL